MIAAWQDVATAAPASFLLGLFAGWIVSQRYAIVRRQDPGGAEQPARRRYDKGGGNGHE